MTPAAPGRGLGCREHSSGAGRRKQWKLPGLGAGTGPVFRQITPGVGASFTRVVSGHAEPVCVAV